MPLRARRVTVTDFARAAASQNAGDSAARLEPAAPGESGDGAPVVTSPVHRMQEEIQARTALRRAG